MGRRDLLAQLETLLEDAQEVSLHLPVPEDTDLWGRIEAIRLDVDIGLVEIEIGLMRENHGKPPIKG